MPKAQALEYEAQVPAFLQRMKQGHAALDGRHNVQIPRAYGARGKQGRLNMTGEEGEDDPVMLDENGNMLSKDDMEALKREEPDQEISPKAESEVQPNSNQPAGTGGRQTRGDLDNVNSGFGKKRKAIKIVCEEGGNEEAEEEGATAAPVKSLKESTKDLQQLVTQNTESAKKEGTKKANKKKKVKLSFDEPE